MYTFLTFITVSCVVSVYALPSRIVGGNDAAIGKYPYQADLRFDGEHWCGASVIHKRHVLTAAHCVPFFDFDAAEHLTVHVGTVRKSEPGIVYNTKTILRHDDYDAAVLANDLALIRVTKDIEYNDLVRPIPLDTTNFARDGNIAVATGWGNLKFRGASPDNLQEISLRIQSPKKCKEADPRVLSTHICTFTKTGEGVCHGDSGGPLVIDGIQIGIVSFGTPCAVGKPDVYTRVFSFNEWIKKKTEESVE